MYVGNDKVVEGTCDTKKQLRIGKRYSLERLRLFRGHDHIFTFSEAQDCLLTTLLQTL